MRRRLAIFILIIITLHSAGRLGLVSFLYEHKARIAYTLGIIGEMPIALCSSDYVADQSLMILSVDDTESVPPLAVEVKEVNPFITSFFSLPQTSRNLLLTQRFLPKQEDVLPGVTSAVFHPPSIG